MNWTEERIELLKKLWAEGHSASQIGKMLGVSKNAVVGKAHRMKLAARPSPIKRSAKSDGTKKEAPAKKAAPKAAKPAAPAAPKPAAKPAAPVAAKPVAAPVPPKPKTPVAPAARVAAPRPAAAPATQQPTAAEIKAASLPAKARRKASMDAADRKLFSGAMEKRRGPKCLWPFGDPGDADFHFCGAPAVPGKPYCAEHCARAYITKSSRNSSNSSNNENDKASEGEAAKPSVTGNKPA